MNKILKLSMCTMLVSTASMSAFSKGTDYGYCNDTTDKIFQIVKVPGKKLPNVFEISEDGMLVVNEDHIKLMAYDDQTDKQVYKFKSVSNKKSILSLFKKNNIDHDSMEYNFEVQRDQKGRIKSITKKGENFTEKAEFTYSKDKCVPTRVVSWTPFSGTGFVADASSCKQLIEQQKDFYKAIRKGSKCLNNLVEMYAKAEETTSKLASKLNKEGAEIDDYIQSIFVGDLIAISEKAKELKKPLENYAEMGEDEFAAQSKMASIISKCTDNFSPSMLNSNKVYRKDGSIKKEDPSSNMSVEESQNVTKE
jgi:hypothetical protein